MLVTDWDSGSHDRDTAGSHDWDTAAVNRMDTASQTGHAAVTDWDMLQSQMGRAAT